MWRRLKALVTGPDRTPDRTYIGRHINEVAAARAQMEYPCDA